jgi:hypothetical protein
LPGGQTLEQLLLLAEDLVFEAMHARDKLLNHGWPLLAGKNRLF